MRPLPVVVIGSPVVIGVGEMKVVAGFQTREKPPGFGNDFLANPVAGDYGNRMRLHETNTLSGRKEAFSHILQETP